MDPWLRDRYAGVGDDGKVRPRARRVPAIGRPPEITRRAVHEADELMRGVGRQYRHRAAVRMLVIVVVGAIAVAVLASYLPR